MKQTRTTSSDSDPATHRAPAARIAAWLTAIVTIVMIATAAFLYAEGATATQAASEADPLTLLPHALISVLMGALVIDRRGNHVVGWLFCLSGIVWAMYALGTAAGLYVLGSGDLLGDDVMIWATGWSSFVAFALAPALVLYVFPTGRLMGPRWRWLVAYTMAVTALGVVGYGFAPGPLEDLPELDNPYGIEGVAGTVATVLREVCWPLLLVGIAGGVASLRARMRAAPVEQRQQIKWFVLAGAVLVGFVAFWGAVETFGHTDAAALVAGLFLPLLPIALGIAILKHRLYDIDVLINRTLVYISLSVVLGLVYVAAVFFLQRLLSPVTADSNLAVAASTLAVAALFRPLRASIQRFIDRRFYRAKYNAATTIGRFATRLRDEVEMDALTGELLGLVNEALQPSTARLWLKGSDS